MLFRSSPFSPRNLPKAKYEIPCKDLTLYKQITDLVPKNNKLFISIITKEFMANIMAKDSLYRTINMKSHMRQMMLKNKEYIHSMGYWDKYLKYLRDNL